MKPVLNLGAWRHLDGSEGGSSLGLPAEHLVTHSVIVKRDTLPSEAQHNTAEVIKTIDADIQCVVEVEDRLTLERFNDSLLKGPRAYPYNIVIDGNDPRGIDVGLLSRFPIAAVNTHVFDKTSKTSKSRIFSRDCLEVEFSLPRKRQLFVLVNHFKSQGYGTQASSDARRKGQANRVAAILRRYDLEKDLVVVAGDFNDGPQSAPLTTLLRTKNLTDVLAKQFPDPRERWTYRDKSQLDYLLVSKPLADAMTVAGIERRGLFEADKLTRNLTSGQIRGVSVRDERYQ
jgi:endonuclease/exonuclease/phosphatase family metal-dependent hydrolase